MPASAFPIVGAIGAWPRDAAVVDRAAEEAASRGAPLVLLHVGDTGAAVADPECLRDARVRASREQPALATHAQMGSGSAVAGIVRASHSADLVVVGSEGAPPRAKVLRGAVTVNVAARAACAVEVVPVPGTPEPSPRTRVVALVHAGCDLERLAPEAFAEAERSGARLEFWAGVDSSKDRQTQRRQLQALLAPWLRSSPAVLSDVLVVPRPLPRSILPLLEPTDLVVLARGHGQTGWGRPEGASRMMIERAPCPVLLVPDVRHRTPSTVGHAPRAGGEAHRKTGTFASGPGPVSGPDSPREQS